MSVSVLLLKIYFEHGWDTRDLACSSSGFLAVRKIPLKRRPRFMDNPDSDNDADAEDPAVDSYLGKIRETLLSDRALHDKASRSTRDGSESVG
jgi:hypothetical protein